jgi:hypothetical protein
MWGTVLYGKCEINFGLGCYVISRKATSQLAYNACGGEEGLLAFKPRHRIHRGGLDGQIMKQILASKIKIYEFPDLEEAEEAERKENKKMKDRVPFAVVGSNTGRGHILSVFLESFTCSVNRGRFFFYQ